MVFGTAAFAALGVLGRDGAAAVDADRVADVLAPAGSSDPRRCARSRRRAGCGQPGSSHTAHNGPRRCRTACRSRCPPQSRRCWRLRGVEDLLILRRRTHRPSPSRSARCCSLPPGSPGLLGSPLREQTEARARVAAHRADLSAPIGTPPAYADSTNDGSPHFRPLLLAGEEAQDRPRAAGRVDLLAAHRGEQRVARILPAHTTASPPGLPSMPAGVMRARMVCGLRSRLPM